MPANVSGAHARLRTIEALMKSKKALGKLEISHASEVSLKLIKDALDDLVETGIVKEEANEFILEIKDSDDEFRVVTEVILDILELLGPLPPRDLADCVKDVLGEDYTPGKVQGVAGAVANSKKTQLRRRKVGGGGASKWGRDFYYLLKQTDELGPRLRLYESSKLRVQWRQRIRGISEEAGTEEGLEDFDAYMPVGEGPGEKFESFKDFIEHLKGLEGYSDQIMHIERIKKKGAKFGEIKNGVHKKVIQALKKDKMFPLYTHQSDAVNAVMKGKNIVITTPNASGKTLCYSIPIFDMLCKDPEGRALYITPTKALEQDQLLRFRKFYISLKERPSAETYDGDTPEPKRKEIKKRFPSIILTNPDELHYGILPFHKSWANFFKNLKYVAIDEMHIYQGVFGSHVANIFRRLRRVCNFYGSDPIFICASATIANPKNFAEDLIGADFTVIDNNGAPQGPKYFIFWNPPIVEGGERRSPYTEAVSLFKEHVKHDVKNITFAKARRIAELVLRWSKADLTVDLGEKVSSYRAGYTPAERRMIEKGLNEGNLVGITATNALELGIDIGDLDATILVGYPGTIASTWQQANRAGRGIEEALITLIALHDPLDQYFMHHPEIFFGKSMENAVIDPRNEYILRDHLVAASLEVPISDDEEIFGPQAVDILSDLEKQETVEHKSGKWKCKLKRPHRYISIRSASRDNYDIIDVSRTRNRVIGIADQSRAFTENHKGAIYIHQGETYYVRDLSIRERKVYVEPIEADYYTEPLRSITVKIIEEGSRKTSDLKRCSLHFGRLEVTEEVKGFVQVRESKSDEKGQVISKENLNLPPTVLKTVGFWLDLDSTLRNDVENADLSFEGGLHGIEHVASAMLPLFAICDRRDLGGSTYLSHSQTDGPSLFVYDNSPGGVGLSEKGYENIDKLLRTTLDAVKDCPCENGCPSCIHSPYCGRRNEGLDKAATIMILEKIIEPRKSKDRGRTRGGRKK
jgi:DEAD/DEAH box helicase domain-containing protein